MGPYLVPGIEPSARGPGPGPMVALHRRSSSWIPSCLAQDSTVVFKPCKEYASAWIRDIRASPIYPAATPCVARTAPYSTASGGRRTWIDISGNNLRDQVDRDRVRWRPRNEALKRAGPRMCPARVRMTGKTSARDPQARPVWDVLVRQHKSLTTPRSGVKTRRSMATTGAKGIPSWGGPPLLP